MRLPQFMGLLCIGGIIPLNLPIASSTAVVQQRKSDTGECSRIDGKQPGIYLVRDADWDDPETVRMILRNNSSCSVILTITGNQTVLRPGVKISQPPLPIAEDGAIVVLKYKVNNVREPWDFMDYWPYEHTVSTLTLNGGRSIKFLARAEHLRPRRRIAVPFNYEGSGFIRSAAAERLVYYPSN